MNKTPTRPHIKKATSQSPGPLASYWSKRDFGATAEPRGELGSTGEKLCFVVQKHAASRLHYDLRLELGGVLVSWAVPKGPSLDPADKRLAVHVEDHPLSYAGFEGTIPPKQYGAGKVIVWDHGTWTPISDPVEGLAKGKLVFELHGQKLKGLWELVKIAKPGEKQEPWILFKKKGDGYGRPRAEHDVLTASPDSVIGGPVAQAVAVQEKTAQHKKVELAPASMPGAVEAPLPKTLKPQLATLATAVPKAGKWLYEIKLDGYRIMARIDNGNIALFTRGGHDWAAKMPALVADLQKLGMHSAWLDGEIVVLDDNGLPDFNQLQKSFDQNTCGAIDFFLFDIPFCEGYDLRKAALVNRRYLLKALVDDHETEHVRFSADFPGDPVSVLSSACKMKLEGIIAKRADAPYSSRRTENWLKVKCRRRQEFVVAGYTHRSDGSAQIGSLLLGVYDDNGTLVSVGSVGTGWDSSEAGELKTRLAKLEIPNAPFPAGVGKPGRWSKRSAGSARWVEPELVAEIEYADMTSDGKLRHATYVSLRTGKVARKIQRELPMTPGSCAPVLSAGPASGSRVKVSHGDRVIDPSTGLRKLDLVRYYESVADFILAHLKARPCALLRGPTGVAGQLFFQKHSERTAIPGLKDMDTALWPGHDALLEVASAQALAAAAQMNAIEFHTWNSTDKAIDRPDRMIFDLDPGEGTTWEHVQEAATLVHGFLLQLGLASWLKTSGGKGLHVVVPLAPQFEYATVKGFSKAVVEHIAAVIPTRFVAKSGPGNRVGKLFIDYLRNGQGATTVAAFSARARPGLGVSMPVSWEELKTLKSGAHWTIVTAREHLSFQSVDPWGDYWKSKQSLTAAMRTLGFEA